MIEIRTKLRRWGNSFGIIVPQGVLENAGVKEGEELTVHVEKKNKSNVLKETFGTLKFRKSTQEIMDEIDEELDSEF